jgi:hypothetical protein
MPIAKCQLAIECPICFSLSSTNLFERYIQSVTRLLNLNDKLKHIGHSVHIGHSMLDSKRFTIYHWIEG